MTAKKWFKKKLHRRIRKELKSTDGYLFFNHKMSRANYGDGIRSGSLVEHHLEGQCSLEDHNYLMEWTGDHKEFGYNLNDPPFGGQFVW